MNWNRRAFLRAAVASPIMGAAKAAKRPNIVFLLTDDQACNALGCMGNRYIQTPNLDKLSADGVTFDRHYDTTAICMGSRATIMTGMYEYKTGCNFTHGSLSADRFARSYPVLLRDAGYRTGFAGKLGFAVTPGMDSNPSDETWDRLPVREFDWWRGWLGQGSYVTAEHQYLAKFAAEYPHTTRALGAAAQEFIRQSANDGRPFCLSISFKAPHKPMVPDPIDTKLYEGVEFPLPHNYGPAGAGHLAKQALTSREYHDRFEWYPEKTYQKSLRIYYQQVYGVDYAVGMVRQELERQGMADNTVLIFTSDNGFFCGSHFFQGKALPYEEGSRAPLIIHDPRNPSHRGSRCSSLTGSIDIAPTILAFAGLTAPDNMDGRSLAALLDRPAGELRDTMALIQFWPWFSHHSEAFSVVSRRYKYIYWFYAGESWTPVEELYDLEKDPYEMANVIAAPEYQPVLEQMRAAYDRHHQHLKLNCVNGNGYRRYIQWTDRHLDPKQKDFRLR